MAAAATGLIAATCVPLDKPGIGWVGTGLAAAGAVATAKRSSHRANAADNDVAAAADEVDGGVDEVDGGVAAAHAAAGRERFRQYAWTVAGLALLAVGAVRAAGWLFVLCVLAAGVAFALALTNTSTVRGMVGAVAAVPAAMLRAIPWATRTLRPAGGLRERDGKPALVRALAVGAISVGLLWIFGALFASADPTFARLLDALTPKADPDASTQGVFLFAAGVLSVLGAAYLLAAPVGLTGPADPASPGARPRRVPRWEWAVPVALLDLLFAAFVLVQLTVLFGGARYVLDEDGPTYAQYARGGFWQLLAVTVLTLPVLAVAARRASRDRPADRTQIRVLLGALASLTLVIVASALHRMDLYEQAYGFTRLRLLVSACELWFGAVFAMVLVAGARLRARWLAQAAAGAAAAVLLGLALLNPVRFIAGHNIDRYRHTGRIDIDYLSRLSADAAPALDRLPAPLRDCALAGISAELAASPGDWRATNLGRSRARDIVAGRPPRPDWPACARR